MGDTHKKKPHIKDKRIIQNEIEIINLSNIEFRIIITRMINSIKKRCSNYEKKSSQK